MMSRLLGVTLIICLFTTTGCVERDPLEDEDRSSSSSGVGRVTSVNWDYNWQTKTLSNSKGRYKIAFPAQPKRDMSADGTEVFSWADSTMALVLSTWPRALDTPDSVMEESCTNSVKRDNLNELSRELKIVPGGFRGYEVLGTTSDGKHNFKMQQFFNTKTKTCYFLLAKGSKDRLDGPESTQFFSSLRYDGDE